MPLHRCLVVDTYPVAMERFITTHCLAFHTSKTGIPAMRELGSSSAAELTVSLAPITIARSILLISITLSGMKDFKVLTSVGEIVVNFLHLKYNIVGDTSLSQQHIELSWHTTSYGVDSKTNLDSVFTVMIILK